VKPEDARFNALISLLQDEDVRVASLAMEQLLQLGPVTEQTIAQYQDCHDPHLRQRMHQLASILQRRQARRDFIEAVASEKMTVWAGVCRITALYDPQIALDTVEATVVSMGEDLAAGRAGAAQVAAVLRDWEFAVPEQDLLDVELYLADSVLESKYGSPVLLCVLGQEIGRRCGWNATVGLYEGRFCLIDGGNLLLDPTSGWHITQMDSADKFHPCGPKDVWLGVLSQLFLVALVEGQLRDLYHFGDLLTALNDAGIEALPPPLGRGE